MSFETYLVLHGSQVDWATPASSVLGLDTWDAGSPSDRMLEDLGLAAEAAAGPRLVTLQGREGSCSFRTRAPLSFEDVDSGEVRPLPGLLFERGASAFVAVLLRPGRRAALVVEPGRL